MHFTLEYRIGRFRHFVLENGLLCDNDYIEYEFHSVIQRELYRKCMGVIWWGTGGHVPPTF